METPHKDQESKNDIKLIAIDMDGTLLNEKHEISDENRKAIQEAQDRGIHVVISTGRSKLTCADLVDSLSLKSYLVTVNGSEIWNESGELVERQLLNIDHVHEMWDLKQKHKTNCWATTVDNVYRDQFPEDLTEHEWMKFGFDVEDDEVRQIIFDQLSQNEDLEITNSSLQNLEINAAGVNKARAIEKVCDKLGITMENVLAMGDSLNDLAMIKEAGIGVAMGNAQEKVKEEADWVTASHIEHGVAKAIRHWAL
ncbi:Cof-type HAD-IIB family hydrolase [Caldalkalibacillus salinus]|uniref:Cof-type HAD-IIB family hydrolase n=1 Tax=Caldalkalibacillus salinus TaxID=2803787 RepID=UPI00192133D0|nr:Cof-type HAD-IIB family hydrolase [Caldalkalibacillus salinus]